MHTDNGYCVTLYPSPDLAHPVEVVMPVAEARARGLMIAFSGLQTLEAALDLDYVQRRLPASDESSPKRQHTESKIRELQTEVEFYKKLVKDIYSQVSQLQDENRRLQKKAVQAFRVGTLEAEVKNLTEKLQRLEAQESERKQRIIDRQKRRDEKIFANDDRMRRKNKTPLVISLDGGPAETFESARDNQAIEDRVAAEIAAADAEIGARLHQVRQARATTPDQQPSRPRRITFLPPTTA